jgi:hypothetical protein
MTEPGKIAEVAPFRPPEAKVIAELESLLKRARKGEILAIGVAYEMPGGYSGHSATFGAWANRPLMVGKLQVLATHIILNECLEWKPT